MRVYEVAYQEETPTIAFEVEGVHGSLPLFEGVPVGDKWPQLSARLEGPLRDVAYLCPGTIVANERAWAALREPLEGAVEVLPIALDGRPWHVLNVLTVIDALDKERSDIKYFTSSGRVMRVVRYAFRPEPLRDAILFKLPEVIRPRMFGTDRLRELVDAAGITGLRLEEVWSSEPTEGR